MLRYLKCTFTFGLQIRKTRNFDVSIYTDVVQTVNGRISWLYLIESRFLVSRKIIDAARLSRKAAQKATVDGVS